MNIVGLLHRVGLNYGSVQSTILADMCMQKTGLLLLAAHQQLLTPFKEHVLGVRRILELGFQTHVPQLRPMMSLPSGSRHGMQTQLLLALEEEEEVGVQEVLREQRGNRRQGEDVGGGY